MGIFSGFLKPGPGIDENEPKKNAFAEFFDLFFRKFWHYIKSNLIYLLFSIPAGLIAYFLITFILKSYVSGVVQSSDFSHLNSYFILGFFVFNFYVSLYGLGPSTAGETYVMRNFSQGEHAWVWSDFVDNLKSNFKQSVLIFIIDLAVLSVSCIAINYYSRQSGLVSWLKIIIIWFLIIYSMMHLYIYPLMVTFKLKIKDIFKNSFLFVFGNLLKTLLAAVILFLLHIAVPLLLIVLTNNAAAVLFVYVLFEIAFLHSISLMLINFTVFPKIKQMMITDQNRHLKNQ